MPHCCSAVGCTVLLVESWERHEWSQRCVTLSKFVSQTEDPVNEY